MNFFEIFAKVHPCRSLSTCFQSLNPSEIQDIAQTVDHQSFLLIIIRLYNIISFLKSDFDAMHNNLSLQHWKDSQADSFLNFGSRKTIKVHLTEKICIILTLRDNAGLYLAEIELQIIQFFK